MLKILKREYTLALEGSVLVEIIHVNEQNVEDYGFFCMRSKPKNAGYQKKLSWLKERFTEGLSLKIIQEDGKHRGFIEYIPGTHTWRAINAKKYMVIHCFWVVGKSKGKGYGSMLLDECIKEAKTLGLSGIAVTTSNKTWLPDKLFFERKGFTLVDKMAEFELMAYHFGDDKAPHFYNWQETARQYRNGITAFTSHQCPFTHDAEMNLKEAAQELHIDVQMIELDSYQKLQQQSPTPFGVFTVIYNGEILTYHPESKNNFLKLLTKKRLKQES